MRDIKKIIDENEILRGRVKVLEDRLEKLKKDIKRGYKRCGSCGKFKPYSNFHKNNSAADGLTSYCADCIKEKYYE